MKVTMGKVGEYFAWWVTSDGMILDTGHNADMRTARDQAKAAILFWSTHEYERK